MGRINTGMENMDIASFMDSLAQAEEPPRIAKIMVRHSPAKTTVKM